MKTKHYIDPNTRVKFKFYPPALWFAMCLQRKKGFWWKTVSWNYASVFRNGDMKEAIEWFLWDEKRERERTEFSHVNRLFKSIEK